MDSNFSAESEKIRRAREAVERIPRDFERLAQEAAKQMELAKAPLEAAMKHQKELEEARKKAMEPQYTWQRDISLLRKPKSFDEENYASEFYERLVKWINKFDESLDENHEVGARLVNFGESITFHIQDIGYWNPSLIKFYGETQNGEPVELIQHVSQISILLMKLPKLDPGKPKRKFGLQKEDPEPNEE